ncbi:hypothetical protein [Carnobacterium maltaromaticum]|uniref:hypothetical protein n=1 Tax=Carnobacterium maltaromaticum TaxID=2751 RepID=UPI0012F891F2|nr:hypothetical protein [Carnobacterium maltaromaticum]
MKFLLFAFLIFLVAYFLLAFSKYNKKEQISKLNKLYTKNIDEINVAIENLSKNLPPYSSRDALEEGLINSEAADLIENLISKMPEIKSLEGFSWKSYSLSFNQSYLKNFENAIQINNLLLDLLEQSKFDFKESLTPTYALKFIFSLPSKFLSFIGFSFSKQTSSNLFNSMLWIITFLLAMFNDEIKQLFISFLK